MFDYKYQLQKDDYMNINAQLLKGSKSFRISFELLKYSVPILLMFFPYLLGYSVNTAYIVIFAIAAFSWLVLFPKYMTRNINKKLSKVLDQRKDSDLFLPKHITIDEKGVRGNSGNEHDVYSWEQIVKVEHVGLYVYFYLNQMQAFVIPVEVIGDVEALLTFIANKKSV